ncbi:Cytochrome P450 [Corchorus olitorius]|uniref:Cytochrome P450 n=1 Tax=Corchorus olitorius TaxID=93759 RepID=A0A1R3HG80_9ROSI|nr:Cytochrome P450 [Corchorus olitorius]
MLPGLLKCRLMEESTDYALMRLGDTAEFKGPCFSNFNFITTSNPMNMNHILCKRFENYDKSLEFREIFFDALGDGIFNAAADSWKGQRKILMALMHSSKFVRRAVKNISQKLDQSLIPLLEHFSKVDAEFDLQDVFQRFTYDNTCTLVFGVDPNSLSIDFPHVASKEAFTEAEEVLLYRHMVPMSLWKLQKWLRIGEEKKMIKAIETVDDFVYKCISSKRERLKNKSQADDKKDEEFDLSTALMDDKEDEGGAVIGKSDKFLRDVVISVLGAGKDTNGLKVKVKKRAA